MRDDSFWSIISEVLLNPVFIAMCLLLGYLYLRAWLSGRKKSFKKFDDRVKGRVKRPEDRRTDYWRKKTGLDNRWWKK